MLLHDGQMERIARRQASMSEDNLLGALSGRPRDVEHLINDAEQGVKGGLDSVSAVNGDIPMKDLLQDLGVGDEPLTIIYQLFEQSLRVALAGVGCAHEIHRNIGIDQNHDGAPEP